MPRPEPTGLQAQRFNLSAGVQQLSTEIMQPAQPITHESIKLIRYLAERANDQPQYKGMANATGPIRSNNAPAG
jgi:hypothetical protein